MVRELPGNSELAWERQLVTLHYVPGHISVERNDHGRKERGRNFCGARDAFFKEKLK